MANYQIKRKTMRVTPLTAAAWLRNNKGNRSISKSRVNRYADIQSRDQWGHAPDPICLSRKGEVLNGQHRLSAQLKSGKTITYEVSSGWDKNVFRFLDKQLTRTVGQDLGVYGGRGWGGHDAAAIKVVELLFREGYSLTAPFYFSSVDAFSAIDRRHEEITWMREVRKINPKFPACVFGALAFAYPTNRDRIDRFARMVISGANLREGSPELALHNFLNTTRGCGRSNGASTAEIIGKVLGAAKLHLDGKSTSKTVYSDNAVKYFQAQRRKA